MEKEYPHTQYMTLNEWKQFVKNFKKNKDNKGESIKNYLLEYENESFFSFMWNAFVFSETPEKFIYWYQISCRTEPVNA